MWCSSGSPRRKLVLWRSGNVVSFLLNPSLPPPSQTYIAHVSLISVILSVIQALLQCHHKCVFNVINDFVVVGQMAATLPRWRNVKSGARNDERGAGRQIWVQLLLNLQGNVVQISRQLFLFFFPHRARRSRFLDCFHPQPQSSNWPRTECGEEKYNQVGAFTNLKQTHSASLILLLAAEWHQTPSVQWCGVAPFFREQTLIRRLCHEINYCLAFESLEAWCEIEESTDHRGNQMLLCIKDQTAARLCPQHLIYALPASCVWLWKSNACCFLYILHLTSCCFTLNVGAAENRHLFIFLFLCTSSLTSLVCWILSLTLEFCRVVNVWVFARGLKNKVLCAIDYWGSSEGCLTLMVLWKQNLDKLCLLGDVAMTHLHGRKLQLVIRCWWTDSHPNLISHLFIDVNEVAKLLSWH